MAAIGLRKPYAKTKVGESCTCMMFIDHRILDDGGLGFLDTGCCFEIKIPGIHFQYQNNEQ
jgi:hypothetical protein